MRRLLLLAVVAVLGGTAGAARADNPQLVGTVGTSDAFAISLDMGGAPVHHLDPGTYSLLVHDNSSLHNFHLSGPGVNVATDIDGTGSQTFTITLSDGTYTFQCDPHSSTMHGSFTVGHVTTAPPPTATATATKASGSVGPGKKISVSSSLKGASEGSFQLTISDKSKTDNFHLSGPGVSKKTGVQTTGTVTWKLTLKAGTYMYRSDAHATLRGSFTISG